MKEARPKSHLQKFTGRSREGPAAGRQNTKKGWGVTQVTQEDLPREYKALSTNPSTAQKRKNPKFAPKGEFTARKAL
jgi:hypothetical protein